MTHILITAGATRNPLDAIRYLSAFSSGSTGVGLAAALSDVGSVTLLGSAEACLRAGDGVQTQEFVSTRDLMARMERWVLAHPDGIVIHAAAVGDYEAAEDDGEKIPSGKTELIIRLRPTPKILDRIRDWSPSARIISFKAASPETTDERLVEIAEAQRCRTGSTCVFANIIGRLQEGILLQRETGSAWHTTRPEALAALVTVVKALT